MKFYVKEIACGGCAQTVRRAIAQVDDVAQVNVDVASKTVEVESTVSEQMIKDALESAGYSATEVRA
ncbi:heavy-metal-associated domain-containing protein [Caballeronia sp. LZ008]|uniref:heavy-metal-associated domain-containing protein n=1 Tax=unclassified Caballeronia TaxID=2646786 RepID=UPI0005A10CC8|nr:MULTISPECIES: heavy-metal-associated domain-containing protein [unclassified Caballeronia]MDR5794217.1 heavy-metal-associated domain-containing protein [Caballeronia sp. LZ008]